MQFPRDGFSLSPPPPRATHRNSFFEYNCGHIGGELGPGVQSPRGRLGRLHTAHSRGATHRRSLNSASFLPLGIAKPNRLPAESSAGHHGDFHMEPLKICACICFKWLSVPLCVSAEAVSSLWPPTVGWLGGPDPASVAWVVPIPVHSSSCSAWLTQPTRHRALGWGGA